ncbi:hypothetical protein AB6813_15235 [bacterium RCC_150]
MMFLLLGLIVWLAPWPLLLFDAFDGLSASTGREGFGSDEVHIFEGIGHLVVVLVVETEKQSGGSPLIRDSFYGGVGRY